MVKENILFRKDKYLNLWQIVIPFKIVRMLINCIHSKLGHPGVYKTAMYLREYYYWKNVNRHIKQFVSACDLFQQVKSINFNMECSFRLVKSYPIKKETTESVLKEIFDLYIPVMGKPKRILADHGSQFSSPKWSDRLRKAGIRVVFSSTRHPKSNPVERVMRELGRLFRTLCADKHARWGKCIGNIEFFLNVTTHFSTGFSPFELHFGVKPTDPIQSIINFPETQSIMKDARERIDKGFRRRTKAQKSSSKIVLRKGNLVLLHIPKQSDALKKVTRKFVHLFYRPYIIIKDFGNNSYELGNVDDPDRSIGVYNQANLRKYIKPSVL